MTNHLYLFGEGASHETDEEQDPGSALSGSPNNTEGGSVGPFEIVDM
jgi:hypothetical protein